MKTLSFKGYLDAQLQILSGLESKSLYKFSELALDNARLKDALSLYIILYTEDNLQDKLLKKFSFMNDSCNKLFGLSDNNIEAFLNDDNLSEYKAIYSNYLYFRNYKTHENKIKEVMHEKIILLQQSKDISNYCIYKNLNLNPGNVNTFLKNGDLSKMSLDTIRNILSFVNEY